MSLPLSASRLASRPLAFGLATAALATSLALGGCQSPSHTPEANAASAPSGQAPALDWQALAQAQGQYPHEAPFLDAPALTQRLQRLLGAQDYALVRQNLEVSAPLQAEGSVFYITGNRAHMGGAEAVAIAMDEASNSIRVWLLHQGQARVFAEQAAQFPWPRDIQVMINNAL